MQISTIQPKIKASRIITGIVTDEEGDPLKGAIISGSRTLITATTDYNGAFSIDLPWEASHLDISLSTYEDQNIAIRDTHQLFIELTSTLQQVEEIEINQYGSDYYEKTQRRTRARPVGGMKSFKKYISENLVLPADAKNNNISGTVKIRFKVLENGSLEDITILKSLGHGCDEEAIRILKEGPKWNVYPNDQSSAVKIITIRF